MSATAPKRPNPDPSDEASPAKIRFIGPGEHQYSSVLEAAEEHLDAYWDGWKDDRAFVVPTIFKWQNPDVSDAMIKHTADNLPVPTKENQKVYNQIKRVITDDRSNAGEHIVFQAFERLAQDQIGNLGHGTQSQHFMAVHSLKMTINENSDECVFPLLPAVDKQEMKNLFIEVKKSGISTDAEFDFVIVGPRIGILIIEVKSATFTKSDGSFLPDQFYKAFEQLGKADLICRVFQDCMPADSAKEEFRVRKILFLPNLKKEKYDSCLTSLAHGRVNSSIEDIILWFNEDMTTESSGQEPSLYRKVLEFLSDPSQLHPISQTAYETCAKVLMVLKSMTRPRKTLELEFDKEILVPLAAIRQQDKILQEQNPRNIENQVTAAYLIAEKERREKEKTEKKKKKEKTLLHDQSALKAPENLLKTSVYFLSKHQLAALNGPKRQLIIGAAGTGKTVVFQEKILELLTDKDKKQTVMIMAQGSFRGDYKKFLREHGYENRRHYRVKTWSFDRRISKNFEVLKPLLYYAWEQKEYSSLAAILRLFLGENQRRRHNTEKFLNDVISQILDFVPLLRIFGQSVMNFAREGKLIEKITSLLPGQEGRNEFTTEGDGNDLDVLCSFIQRATRNRIGKLKSAVPWMHECDHIFIDDFLDAENSQLRNPYTFVVGVVLFVETARAINPNMVVWAAMDPYKGKSLGTSEAGSKEFWSNARPCLKNIQDARDGDGRQYKRVSTVVLKQVMRCSKQIFDHCYADGDASQKWEADLRPEAGHKILGMQPIVKAKNFSTKEEAQENLWQEISKWVKHLTDLECEEKHFAIIVGHERKEDIALYQFLTDRYQQIGSLQADGINWEQVKGQTRMWNEVSSGEWPIVIYVNVVSQGAATGEEREYIKYVSYRGQTRAKVCLITYDYSYGDPTAMEPKPVNAQDAGMADKMDSNTTTTLEPTCMDAQDAGTANQMDSDTTNQLLLRAMANAALSSAKKYRK